MKLTKIYNEVKISNPGENFLVTKKGKTDSKWFNEFWVAARNLDCQDMIWNIDEISNRYPYLLSLSHLNVLSDLYGENIIYINKKNNIQEVIKDYTYRIGDEEDIINQLKDLMKYNYITKIQI